jgi:hypothetical protein
MNQDINDNKEIASEAGLLDDALARGIISDSQREQLAKMQQSDALDSDERIQSISKFNELFMSFGVFVLLNALEGLLGQMLSSDILVSSLSVVLALAVAFWFHHKKRFRLPILYCALRAAFSVAVALRIAYTGQDDFLSAIDETMWPLIIPLGAGLITLIAATGFFRIPFLMLPIGVLFTIIITTAAQFSDNDLSLRLLLGGCGLLILSIAIMLDLKDNMRVTRTSDYAFWAYVIGSPLFVHSLLLPLIINDIESLNIPWLLIAVMVLGVTLVGLCMNRRALILSSLVYVSILLGKLMTQNVFSNSATGLLITMLVMGAYVMLLGAKWGDIRHYALSRIAKYIPATKHLPRY